MYKSHRRLIVASLWATTSGFAQTVTAGETSQPGHSSLTYESVFSEYRSYSDEPIADWRAVNDDVGRIGGHVGIVGGAGHGAHGAGKAAAPAEPGQPPQRGAPQSPADDHARHH